MWCGNQNVSFSRQAQSFTKLNCAVSLVRPRFRMLVAAMTLGFTFMHAKKKFTLFPGGTEGPVEDRRGHQTVYGDCDASQREITRQGEVRVVLGHPA